jgi:hypothetical protein
LENNNLNNRRWYWHIFRTNHEYRILQFVSELDNTDVLNFFFSFCRYTVWSVTKQVSLSVWEWESTGNGLRAFCQQMQRNHFLFCHVSWEHLSPVIWILVMGCFFNLIFLNWMSGCWLHMWSSGCCIIHFQLSGICHECLHRKLGSESICAVSLISSVITSAGQVCLRDWTWIHCQGMYTTWIQHEQFVELFHCSLWHTYR